MFLNQATKAPVVIEAGDYRLGFKKFRLRDWGLMTSEFVSQKENELTRGMEPDIAYRFKTFSPVIPPTLVDIKEWSRSAPGVAKIIQLSLTTGRCLILAKRRAGAVAGSNEEWEEFSPPLQPSFSMAARVNGKPATPALPADPDAAAIVRLIDEADDDDLATLAFNISDIYNRRAQLNEQSELEGQETFGGAKKEETENPLT